MPGSTLYFSRWGAARAVLLPAGLIAIGMSGPVPAAAAREDAAATVLVYRIDTAQVTAAWLQSIQMDVRHMLQGENIGHDGVRIVENQVRLILRDPGKRDLALSRLKTLAVPLSSWPWRRHYDLTVTGGENGLIAMEPTPEGLRNRLERELLKSSEAIRRRADPNGAGEAIVALEGKDGISVRVPGAGVSDVKARIGARARLAFQLVDESMTAEVAESTGVPPGDELLPDKENPGRFVLVRKEAAVSGGDVQDASAGIDSMDNRPYLSFELNARGAAAFARVTRENIGKPSPLSWTARSSPHRLSGRKFREDAVRSRAISAWRKSTGSRSCWARAQFPPRYRSWRNAQPRHSGAG